MKILEKTEGKEFQIFKLILLVTAVFIIVRLLNKFGLLGKSDEEKDVEKLSESTALNDEIGKGTKLGKAIVKATGKKTISKSDVERLTPNRPNFNKWINQIWDSKGFFKDNEDKVYSVFRQMNSQFEINMFSKVFSTIKQRDLFGFLSTFMNDKELSIVYNIIKNKKLA